MLLSLFLYSAPKSPEEDFGEVLLIALFPLGIKGQKKRNKQHLVIGGDYSQFVLYLFHALFQSVYICIKGYSVAHLCNGA